MNGLKPLNQSTRRFGLISLILVVSLGLGVWIGRESTETSGLLHSEDRLSQTADRLSHEMRLFESEVFGRAREPLVETTALGASSRSHPSLLGQVELKRGVDGTLKVASITARDPQLKVSLEPELKQLAISDTRIAALSSHGDKSAVIGFFKLGLERADLLVVAALVGSDTIRVTAIELGLTEWAKRWNQTKTSADTGLSRPLVWDQNGTLVFHPTASWRGRNLGQSAYFEAQVRPAFQSAGTELQLANRRSIDQLSVFTATGRLKRLPLAVTLEESRDPRLVHASSEISAGSLRKISGMVIACFGALLISAWFLSRPKVLVREVTQVSPPPAPVQALAVEAVAAPSVISAGPARVSTPSQVQIAVEEFDAGVGGAPGIAPADNTLARFENDLRAARDLRRVTEILTQAVSAVYGSRALYFRHYEPGHALILSADSTGQVAPGSHQNMWSVPVSQDLKARVAKEGARTPILSASHDEAISKLLLVREGSGVFEGWGWTAFGGKSTARLLGLIVIPSPSSTALLRSETLRQNLFRIFQTAALVYENLLLSQTHIQPDASTASRRYAQSLLPPQ